MLLTSAALLFAVQAAVPVAITPPTGQPPLAPVVVASALTVDTVRQASPPRQPVLFDASRFDTLTANSLRAIFDDAVSRGLPVKLLVNRALEGAARKVGGARVLRVVRDWADALATAKFALGEGTTDAELDAAAVAIRAGIDPRTVAAVRATRSPGTAVTALVVLTDLVQRGVPAATAREAVATVSRQPRSDDALQSLQQVVAKNAGRGPGMALEALNRYVREASSGANPSSVPTSADRKPVRPPDS
jgi:hypothetical protein